MTAADEIRARLDGADDDALIELPARTLRSALEERDALLREIGKLATFAEDLWCSDNDERLFTAVGTLRHLFAEAVTALEMRDLEAADAAIAECRGAVPDRRTPEQWCDEYGLDIRDPDGWRGQGDPAWDEPITLPDFLRRAARSTCHRVTTDVWNRLTRDAHRAAEAERDGASGPSVPQEGP